jgi:hypothetical protein
MPLLRNLTEDEQRALIHKIKNSNRKFGNPDEGLFYDEIISKNLEKKLASLSEEENYNLKNRYRFQAKTMDWADKKRMPIDEWKVKDILRN